jgi:hypothetical protein
MFTIDTFNLGSPLGEKSELDSPAVSWEKGVYFPYTIHRLELEDAVEVAPL